jgi:Family of unknown function (DUF6151)
VADQLPPLPYRCACGTMRGSFDAQPTGTGRVRCYCDDCQAYARWLGRDDTTDSYGGTDVVQSWPSQLRIDEGHEALGLLRLSSKGLFRWYATCCRAPLANSFGHTRIAFTGVMRNRLDAPDAEIDQRFGPAIGVQGRFAPGGVPPGAVKSATVGVMWGGGSLLLRGWWAGGQSPSPFFDAQGQPLVAATVLDADARTALRSPPA